MLKKVPELISEIRQNIQCISAVEGIEKCKHLEGVLIDVREPIEYSNQSAKGAINIPRGVLEMKIVEHCPDAEKAIFVYCATGGRASFATEQLLRLGYKNVWAITCKCEEVIDCQ